MNHHLNAPGIISKNAFTNYYKESKAAYEYWSDVRFSLVSCEPSNGYSTEEIKEIENEQKKVLLDYAGT
jgi:hypothetical protein